MSCAFSLKEFFWSNVIMPETINSCWIWKGKKVPRGYGRFKFKGIYYSAHRLSFKLFIDPLLTNNNLICHKKVYSVDHSY